MERRKNVKEKRERERECDSHSPLSPPLFKEKRSSLSLVSNAPPSLHRVCSGTAVVERFLPRPTLSEVAVQVEPAFESDVGLSAFSQLFIFVFQFPRAILFHSSPPLASFIGHWRTCSITIRRLRTKTQILKQNTHKKKTTK